MQFIDLRKVKEQLRNGDLPAVDVVRYVAGQAALGAVLFVPSPAGKAIDWDLLTFPLLGIGGVVYCYRCNGASRGLRFAERYLALSWVVGWRAALAASALVAISAVALALAGQMEWLQQEWVPTAVSALTFTLIACIYWRIGTHLHDVHGNSSLDASP